jgi:hypothetical protein
VLTRLAPIASCTSTSTCTTRSPSPRSRTSISAGAAAARHQAGHRGVGEGEQPVALGHDAGRRRAGVVATSQSCTCAIIHGGSLSTVKPPPSRIILAALLAAATTEGSSTTMGTRKSRSLTRALSPMLKGSA